MLPVVTRLSGSNQCSLVILRNSVYRLWIHENETEKVRWSVWVFKKVGARSNHEPLSKFTCPWYAWLRTRANHKVFKVLHVLCISQYYKLVDEWSSHSLSRSMYVQSRICTSILSFVMCNILDLLLLSMFVFPLLQNTAPVQELVAVSVARKWWIRVGKWIVQMLLLSCPKDHSTFQQRQ